MTDRRKHSLKELRTIFAENDRKLEAAKMQLIDLSALMLLFRETEDNIKELTEFYQSATWMEGREIIFAQDEGEHHPSAAEDSIWDIAHDLYCMKVRFLKMLGDSLSDELPEGQR